MSGVITGPNTTLVKVGPGTLALSRANTYSGETTLSLGEIVVGNNSALGTSAVSMNHGSTLSLDSGITVSNDIAVVTLSIGNINVLEGTGTLSGVISGTDSALRKKGGGKLSLTGNNTYTAGTWVNSGTLSVSHANSLGAGMVYMQGGGLNL